MNLTFVWCLRAKVKVHSSKLFNFGLKIVQSKCDFFSALFCAPRMNVYFTFSVLKRKINIITIIIIKVKDEGSKTSCS